MPLAAPRPASDLTDVARQLGVTLDIDRLATSVVERMVELLAAERALFALFDHAGEVEHVVHHGFAAWPGLPAPLPVSHTIIDDAVTSGELVVESDPGFGGPWSGRQSARALNLRFMFAMPVQVRGQTVGVLYVDSRQSALRGIDDVEGTLVALAHLVGAAVDNARLWEEVAFRNLLLAQMVHDFALPVSAIEMNAAQLMREGCTSSAAVEIGIDIGAATARMTEMITTTLQLCRVADAAPQHPSVPVSVHLPTFLRQQLAALEEVRRSAGIGFELAAGIDAPSPRTLPDRLRPILANLLFNAVKYAPAGSVVALAVRTRPDVAPEEVRAWRPESSAYLFRRATNLLPTPGTSFVEVSITNAGPAIPPDQASRLFRPWSRPAVGGADGTRAPSHGLGLAIVEQCVRSLGGRVWAESAPGVTTFRFTLPVDAEPR